jgi:hypothetical protein
MTNFIRVKDIPAALGVSRSTVRRMIDRGDINLCVMTARCVGITQEEKTRIFDAAAARGKNRKPKPVLMPKAQRLALAEAESAASAAV